MTLRSKTPQQQGDHEEDDEPDDEPGTPRVTNAAARHSVQLLQRYLTEQGFSDKLQCALDTCAEKGYETSTLDLQVSVN